MNLNRFFQTFGLGCLLAVSALAQERPGSGGTVYPADSSIVVTTNGHNYGISAAPIQTSTNGIATLNGKGTNTFFEGATADATTLTGITTISNQVRGANGQGVILTNGSLLAKTLRLTGVTNGSLFPDPAYYQVDSLHQAADIYGGAWISDLIYSGAEALALYVGGTNSPNANLTMWNGALHYFFQAGGQAGATELYNPQFGQTNVTAAGTFNCQMFDRILHVDATAGNITINLERQTNWTGGHTMVTNWGGGGLPATNYAIWSGQSPFHLAANCYESTFMVIHRKDTSANTVTIVSPEHYPIWPGGGTNLNLLGNQSVLLTFDGTNVYALSGALQIVAGANVTVTTNAAGAIVVASSGGGSGGFTGNASQFASDGTTTNWIKGAKSTNDVIYGGATNNVTLVDTVSGNLWGLQYTNSVLEVAPNQPGGVIAFGDLAIPALQGPTIEVGRNSGTGLQDGAQAVIATDGTISTASSVNANNFAATGNFAGNSFTGPGNMLLGTGGGNATVATSGGLNLSPSNQQTTNNGDLHVTGTIFGGISGSTPATSTQVAFNTNTSQIFLPLDFIKARWVDFGDSFNDITNNPGTRPWNTFTNLQPISNGVFVGNWSKSGTGYDTMTNEYVQFASNAMWTACGGNQGKGGTNAIFKMTGFVNDAANVTGATLQNFTNAIITMCGWIHASGGLVQGTTIVPDDALTNQFARLQIWFAMNHFLATQAPFDYIADERKKFFDSTDYSRFLSNGSPHLVNGRFGYVDYAQVEADGMMKPAFSTNGIPSAEDVYGKPIQYGRYFITAHQLNDGTVIFDSMINTGTNQSLLNLPPDGNDVFNANIWAGRDNAGVAHYDMTASNITAAYFHGDGTGITGVSASLAPNLYSGPTGNTNTVPMVYTNSAGLLSGSNFVTGSTVVYNWRRYPFGDSYQFDVCWTNATTTNAFPIYQTSFLATNTGDRMWISWKGHVFSSRSTSDFSESPTSVGIYSTSLAGTPQVFWNSKTNAELNLSTTFAVSSGGLLTVSNIPNNVSTQYTNYYFFEFSVTRWGTNFPTAIY